MIKLSSQFPGGRTKREFKGPGYSLFPECHPGGRRSYFYTRRVSPGSHVLFNRCPLEEPGIPDPKGKIPHLFEGDLSPRTLPPPLLFKVLLACFVLLRPKPLRSTRAGAETYSALAPLCLASSWDRMDTQETCEWMNEWMNEEMIHQTTEQVNYNFGLYKPYWLNSLRFSEDLEGNMFGENCLMSGSMPLDGRVSLVILGEFLLLTSFKQSLMTQSLKPSQSYSIWVSPRKKMFQSKSVD